MTRESSPDHASLSPGQLLEINRVCDRFEDVFRAGRHPAIEEALATLREQARHGRWNRPSRTTAACRAPRVTVSSFHEGHLMEQQLPHG